MDMQEAASAHDSVLELWFDSESSKSLIGGLEIGPWAHPLCVSVGAVQLEHAETI